MGFFFLAGVRGKLVERFVLLGFWVWFWLALPNKGRLFSRHVIRLVKSLPLSGPLNRCAPSEYVDRRDPMTQHFTDFRDWTEQARAEVPDGQSFSPSDTWRFPDLDGTVTHRGPGRGVLLTKRHGSD